MPFTVTPTIEVTPSTVLGHWVRYIDTPAVNAFWDKKAAVLHADRRGVYVFSVKGKGPGAPVPWYVGKTVGQTFAQEVFASRNAKNYTAAMTIRRGRPSVTLVHWVGTGAAEIDKLETLLIWIAAIRNPELLNQKKRYTSLSEILWLLGRIEIQGVLNSGPGKPSEAAKAFRRMLGLQYT